jgi:hypothetical protein
MRIDQQVRLSNNVTAAISKALRKLILIYTQSEKEIATID